MKILFVCVHPDDLEFSCSNMMHDLVIKGHLVQILCLTKGEFGIFIPEWKGPRLGKIRVSELQKAAKINGISKENVFFGDIIDGFVRFSQPNLKMVIEWLNRLQPDVVIAPEPYYTYYWHPDHIHCGKLVYHACFNAKTQLKHPVNRILFYVTSKANFYWPFNGTDHVYHALYQHRSQWWVLKWNKLFYPLQKRNLNRRKLGPWRFTETYRSVTPDQVHAPVPYFWRCILPALSHMHIIDPPPEHFFVPDMKSPFGQAVSILRKKYHMD